MRQQANINLDVVIERKRPTHLLEFWLSGCHLVESGQLCLKSLWWALLVGQVFGRKPVLLLQTRRDLGLKGAK
jgi:hypothetical protein